MNVTAIPAGTTVFVDANPLVYHFAAEPVLGPPCKPFLERIERQEITAYTSTHVLADVAHRLMTLEAIAAFGWPAKGIAHRLGNHPNDIPKLATFRRAVEAIRTSRIQVLPASSALMVTAAILAQQLGLLTDDALIVALMQAQGLVHIVSQDADFDRVPGLARFSLT